ncbi:uncharacterized protein EMH_0058240 [Eimeria mitis]|uniref:SAG family member n=1 Tax=Eimeria mitis TaxID=44415 RepID=U6KB55_9EIME|nr:uncharacterized protein EMH_0058240 [Eimeria mitis]CDJ34026.1 hypothetical protein EMH_0058240 [Eimeria mitis]
MIPLYKTAAAVCLVALCGLQTEASTPTYKFKVEDVQPDAYLSANLARNGKLPIRISTVTKDDALVDSLKSAVQAATGENAGACEGLITSDLKKTFRHAFDYQVDAGTTPNYRQLLQEAVEEGLAAFDEEYFNGLTARTTALKDMTADDLQTPVGDGAEAAAIPTILIAGLVAMLTLVSA